MKTVIGIDPDTTKHGVAIYEDEKLVKLEMLPLTGLIEIIQEQYISKWVIEEVTKNNAVYNRNIQRGGSPDANARMNMKIARNVGMCQQSMIELERVLQYYRQNYMLVPPARDNWAKNKPRFENMTGWRGRSNVDTRSAAYFGFLGL